jgi:DNA repair exonuclease SbcCD ATPase subunit
MTLVGKIFSILVLLLSMFFLAASAMVYATHRNWRTEAESLRGQLTQKDEQVKQLQNEKNDAKMALAREQAARRYALAAQYTKLQESNAQLQDEVKKNVELLSDLGELSTQNRVNVQQLEQLTTENTALRGEILEAREDRNEKVAEVVRLTDELNRLRGEQRTLVSRRDQLIQLVAEYKHALDVNGIQPTDDPDAQPYKVDGIVTDVSNELIEISIGMDDGLKKNHTLEVYRNKVYLGQAIVLKVTPDRAVARIVPEMKQGIIKRGDRVSTKLS